jgi:hypothetical protein
MTIVITPDFITVLHGPGIGASLFINESDILISGLAKAVENKKIRIREKNSFCMILNLKWIKSLKDG